MLAESLVGLLGFVGVIIAAAVVWARLGFGYGALVAVAGLATLARASWFALAIAAIVWWRGGRHDVVLWLAAFAAFWWLTRWLVALPLRWLGGVYAEERAAERAEVVAVTMPECRALEWIATSSADLRPIRTDILLVALIASDSSVRWGSLSGLSLRADRSAEEGSTEILTGPNGPIEVTSSTARAIRLSHFLSEAYDLPASAGLTALALTLEGPAARELMTATGIADAEALDVLQGDPIGAELEDLGQTAAHFAVVDREAERAHKAADGRQEVERSPWMPRFVTCVAVGVTVLMVWAAVPAAASVSSVLEARDLLHAGMDDLRAGRTDEAISALSTVVQEYPDSTAALIGLSCPLWDLGYRDHAMIYFAALLAAGFRPSGRPSNCFATAPQQVGIETVELGMAVRPFAVNPADASDLELMGLLNQVVDAPESHWQAELLLACLNHQHGFRLLAGSNLQAAELALVIADDNGGAVSTIDVPARCIEYTHAYRMIATGGELVALPNDAAQRFYIPGVSPAAPEYDNSPTAGLDSRTESDVDVEP